MEEIVLEGEIGEAEELAELKRERMPRPRKIDLQAILTQPHTVTALVVVGAALAAVALGRGGGPGATTAGSVKLGLCGACTAFLVFALCQFPDGLFRRPHPLFWRVVMGAGVLYAMLLVFLLFQSLDDARWMVGLVDPRLGRPLPERSYAVDCRVWTPESSRSRFANVRAAIEDEFFLAHAVGWWVKTLMLRDVRLTLLLSGLFELLELSLQHVLPNFAECWWDHVVLDLIVANGLGIWVGHHTLRWLEMKKYNWSGIAQIRTTHGRIVRVLGQFTPESWTRFHWGIFSSWKRFLYFLFLVFMTEAVELGAFTLKALLWIPPPHPLVVARLALMALVVAPALREYYSFMIDPTVHVFGPNAWICCGITVLEMLLTFKWTRGMEFPAAPAVVRWSWVGAVSVIALFFFTYFPYREYLRRRASSSRSPSPSSKPASTQQQQQTKTKSKKKPKAK